MAKERTVVVAIGGNALMPPGELGAVADELSHARVVARDLARLVAEGRRLVVTHGNGPQVGIILRRSDLTASLDPSLPRLPLSYCVAETQGGIGHLLASALRDELRERGVRDQVIATLMHAVVDPADPAFAVPTKPIGPFYTAAEAERMERGTRRELVEDAGRGYRRVVPSPTPRRLLEASAVATLLDAGYVVVTGGGGGIPVVERPDGSYQAADAVIDKDRLSALLAADLRADDLVLSTAVDRVALDFGTPAERGVAQLTVEEAERHLAAGQFPPGSMGPKIASAIEFVRAHDGQAIITSLEHVHDALDGRAGTRIVRASVPASEGSRP
ncbi:MAG TPA: carbamate kinase [Candidatus Limnocylindria bacterium]|jgi:carbamate kinase|nr:carbamate kinase [Candidatus Limnocylindria bacterium]